MAKLTYKQRKKLPASDFVFPSKRAYPIEDKAHARAAKSRAAHKGGAVEKKVDAAVARKYPGIGKRGSEHRRTAKKSRKRGERKR